MADAGRLILVPLIRQGRNCEKVQEEIRHENQGPASAQPNHEGHVQRSTLSGPHDRLKKEDAQAV